MSKTILITGATAGIGRHAALHLAHRGHRVIATGRNEDALAALRAEAESDGVTIDTLRLDVTDPASIEAAETLVDRLTEGHGLDVLVNNAGYGLAGALAEVSDADLRAQFDTNVFGAMAVTRAFLPAMIRRGGGRILNVSSIGGRVTFPMMGAYHASKYALEALSDALRLELAPFGIDVVLIEPGPIDTNFLARMNDAADPYRTEASLYAGAFPQIDAIERRTTEMSGGPEPVSRAMARAIATRRPRARYVAPASSAVGLALVRMIPTPWRDGLFRLLFGLRRHRLAPAGAPAAA
jgi:NAD(P)-dependent dehydrogenase (short-subunit alcohol dehydrogenase family)